MARGERDAGECGGQRVISESPKVTDMPPAIETHALTRDFGKLRALDNLDMTVEQGEIFGFLGPNGAGKSTAIRLMLDFIRPTYGYARVMGFDCQADSMEVRRRVGYLPGDIRVYPALTGRETIAFFCEMRGYSAAESGALELAERLQLRLDVKSGTYSKGNRQKLGIVLALMGSPDVLMLDEPSSGLDPLIQHELWTLLREQAARGVTVFFSSHVMSEVEMVCERVAILRQGKLVALEGVAEMKTRAVRHLIARFADEVPPDGTFTFDGVRELRRERDLVELEVQGEVDPVLKALSQHRVVDLVSEQPSLEELLMRFYERERSS